MAQEPLVGQGLLIIEASRPDSYTPYSVGILWTNDQFHSEISIPDKKQHSQETDIPVPGRIRTRNPSERASGRRLTDG